jgi:hypothetical protein
MFGWYRMLSPGATPEESGRPRGRSGEANSDAWPSTRHPEARSPPINPLTIVFSCKWGAEATPTIKPRCNKRLSSGCSLIS